CPRISWTSFRDAPHITRWLAAVCRRSWNRKPVIPARVSAASKAGVGAMPAASRHLARESCGKSCAEPASYFLQTRTRRSIADPDGTRKHASLETWPQKCSISRKRRSSFADRRLNNLETPLFQQLRAD